MLLGAVSVWASPFTKTEEDLLFGNANNNTSDVIEQALLCKYFA